MSDFEAKKAEIRKRKIRRVKDNPRCINQSAERLEAKKVAIEIVAKKIEDMGGITLAMEEIIKNKNRAYSTYFRYKVEKNDWKVDEEKLLDRDRWREEWDSKSTAKKLDIIESNIYQEAMEDNLPFEGRSISYTKNREKRAIKAARKARRSAEAFLNDYKGKYALYKHYHIIMTAPGKFFKNLKKKISSKLRSKKSDRE